jgi:hypothetical protein
MLRAWHGCSITITKAYVMLLTLSVKTDLINPDPLLAMVLPIPFCPVRT